VSGLRVRTLKEEEMFPILIDFLSRSGYKVVETHPGRQRGPDIVARKSGREMVVEAKGDTAALAVDLGTAIWQLLRYMKNDSKDFALAVTPSYTRYVEAVEYPLKKLNVRVFIVSREGIEIL
jgi:HJR/Mrr/RecB family endonuclease